MNKQYCPICKNEVVLSERYPNYVCMPCIGKALDLDGKPIAFYNRMDGSMYTGKYNNAGPYRNELYIDGVKCRASEAYMGGIVVRPVREKIF